MNVWDVILGAVLVLVIGLAVRSTLRRRKTSSCCGCPQEGACQHAQDCCDQRHD